MVLDREIRVFACYPGQSRHFLGESLFAVVIIKVGSLSLTTYCSLVMIDWSILVASRCCLIQLSFSPTVGDVARLTLGFDLSYAACFMQ